MDIDYEYVKSTGDKSGIAIIELCGDDAPKKDKFYFISYAEDRETNQTIFYQDLKSGGLIPATGARNVYYNFIGSSRRAALRKFALAQSDDLSDF